MKVATRNVNGIRARAGQLCEWLERDRRCHCDAHEALTPCGPIAYHAMGAHAGFRQSTIRYSRARGLAARRGNRAPGVHPGIRRMETSRS